MISVLKNVDYRCIVCLSMYEKEFNVAKQQMSLYHPPESITGIKSCPKEMDKVTLSFTEISERL